MGADEYLVGTPGHSASCRIACLKFVMFPLVAVLTDRFARRRSSNRHFAKQVARASRDLDIRRRQTLRLLTLVFDETGRPGHKTTLSSLDFRRPGQSMLAIHGTGRGKIFRAVQGSNGDIDASRLFVTLPAQHSPAGSAELPNYAWRRGVLSRSARRVLELVRCNEKPCHRLRACRTPAIWTMTHKNLVRWTDSSVANRSALAPAD
jgi:hypothetical protein